MRIRGLIKGGFRKEIYYTLIYLNQVLIIHFVIQFLHLFRAWLSYDDLIFFISFLRNYLNWVDIMEGCRIAK